MSARERRLRRLLDLRHRTERDAGETLALATRRSQDISAMLHAACNQRRLLEETWRRSVAPGVLNVGSVGLMTREAAVLEQQIDELGHASRKSIRAEEQARQNYLDARRDALSFEKLLERILLEQRQVQSLIEGKEMDDAARRAYLERRRDSADNLIGPVSPSPERRDAGTVHAGRGPDSCSSRS